MSANETANIWIRIQGQRRAIADLTATSAAVGGLREETNLQGLASLRASERTWLHNQALFTLRRYAYAGTLALTALVGVMLKWGNDFNNTMQSSRVALQPVFKSTRAVNQELATLYNFTKYTPFQFKDVTTAFRGMYISGRQVGLTVRDVNQTIFALTDALASVGKDTPAALNRVSVALMHMMNLGHLTGQSVQQLARDGIQIQPALRKELGLTEAQLKNIASLNLPAKEVLDAINKYVESTPGLEGAARRQAGTLHGMLTTLRDNISQTMGALEFRTFARGPGFIKGINDMFDQIQNQIKKNGGKISLSQVLDIAAQRYSWLGPVRRGFELLWRFIQAVGNILLHGLIPAAFRVAVVFGTVLYPFLLVGVGILQMLSHHSTLLQIAFAGLLTYLALMKIAMMIDTGLRIANALATMGMVRSQMMATAWTERLTYAELMNGVAVGNINRKMALQFLMLGRIGSGLANLRSAWAVLTTGVVARDAGVFRSLTKLEAFAYSLRTAFLAAGGGMAGFTAALGVARAAFVTFLATIGPVGWAIILIGIFTTLYFSSERFRKAVDFLWHNLIYWAPIVAVALASAFAPVYAVAAAILVVIRYWQQLKNISRQLTLGGAAHPRRGGVTAHQGFSTLWGALPSWASLPGLQAGGLVTRPGSFMVGEHGPEIASLPVGSAISPMPSVKGIAGDINLTAILKIDGKTFATALATVMTSQEARL